MKRYLRKDLIILKEHLKREDDFLIYFIQHIKPRALVSLLGGFRANLISNYQEGLEALLDNFLSVEDLYYLDKPYLDMSYLKVQDRLIDLEYIWEHFTSIVKDL